MDFGRLLKWVVIIAVAIYVFRVVVPWVKAQKMDGSRTSISSATGGGADDPCSRAAAQASERWGSGLAQFVNPPYDLNAWSSFKSNVDSQISSAESKCSCAKESCTKVRGAMGELRSLVSDMDRAIRTGGSPGGNIVQQQEHIDMLIEEAGDLARAGK